MSYKIQEDVSGIRGTATLVCKTTHSGDNTYPYYDSGFGVVHESPGNGAKIRRSLWSLTDVTGDFTAIGHDGNLGYTNTSNTAIKLENNKKILIIGHFSNRTQTSAAHSTHSIITTTGGSSTTTFASGYNNSSSLTQYYATNFRIYANDYSDEIPESINNGEIGKYFKRAGIHKLNDSLLYAFMEIPSSGNFYLAHKLVTRTNAPGWASIEYLTANAHFLKIIEFS